MGYARRIMRKAIVSAACATLFAISTAATSAHAQSAQRIFKLTNRDRVSRGLQPLHWDASLAAAAQTHAQWMAGEGNLSHQYPGEADLVVRAAQTGAHFQAIAENIATGYSEDAVEAEWMHSTPHRTNILDPRMNAIGIGVVARNGTLYAVEDFADAAEALSPAQVASRVDALLRAESIDPSAPRDAAAQACASASGVPPGGRLVVRFDTPDLSRLPEQAAAQIRSGSYRKASVAACPGGGRQGSFTTYRVAIVLY
jgi:uncharacterized protein YkwD